MSSSAVVPLVFSAVVALAVIAGATVALCLGHLDSQTFAALVGSFGGAGVGIGAHAAGTRA